MLELCLYVRILLLIFVFLNMFSILCSIFRFFVYSPIKRAMIDILDDLASGIHIVFSTTTFSEMVHVLEENGGALYHPQAALPISPSLTFLTA